MAFRLIDLGNPEHYPVTDGVAHVINEELLRREGELPMDQFKVLYQMVENLSEYEHGSVDISDVSPDLTIKQYGDVVADLALTLLTLW